MEIVNYDFFMGRVVEERELRVEPLPMCGEKAPVYGGDRGVVGVERCVNMRRDGTTGWLTAAGRPVRNGKLTSLPLLTLHDGGEGRMAVISEGQRLRMVYLDMDKAGYDMGGVSGRVKCIVMTGTDRGVVMTDADRYAMVKDSGGLWRVRERSLFPALQFVAADVMRLSADAEERELAGIYDTRSTVLTDADTDRLGKDLLRCYRELYNKTTRAGLELQPVLARYRLEGADGEVLYRSPVVQVGASGGVQCADELHCELSDDGRRRGKIRVAADVYRLRLRQVTAANEMSREVKSLVVETSLPVHPVDAGVTAANVLGRSGTNGVVLRCFLPGASVTMVSARRHAAHRLERLAMKGDVAFREALVVQNPFEGDASLDVEVRVARAGVPGIDGEIAAVGDVLAKRVDKVPDAVAKCMVPNRFTAGSGCVSGENAVWGEIYAKAFAGYRIEEMTAAFTEEGERHPWRCVVVTELVSGESCVATSWGTECAPLRLSPVLCYPRADGVSMTVVLERDGIVYRGSFDLSVNESRTASCHFNPGGGEIELEATEEAFAYVDDTRCSEGLGSTLLVARAESPIDPVAAQRAGSGRITAMLAVDRRGSAWEFGSHRVYAMTDCGIYLLGIGAGPALRCNRLDRRGVVSASSVTETDDDRWPVVCVASGDLLGLSRGNVTTLEEGVREIAAGWDSVRKELWLAGGDGRARVKVRPDGGWYEAGGLAVSGFHDAIGGLLIESDLGIRDTSAGESEMTEFGYSLRCRMPALGWYRRGMRLLHVGAELHSRNVNGVMRVASRTVAESDAGTESAVEFRGEVNTPLSIGLWGCRGAVTDVGLSGEMASGSTLREIVLSDNRTS